MAVPLQLRLVDVQGSIPFAAWLTGVTDRSLAMPQFWYGAISSKEFEAFAVSVGMKPVNSLCMYITLLSLTCCAT